MTDASPLFHDDPEVQRPDLPDADLEYRPRFFAAGEADRLFDAVHTTIAWRQDEIQMYGRRTPIPRLQAWYGDPGATYTYSNLELAPLPWTPALREIKDAIEAALGAGFNSVLANCYRDGNDSVAWHADDEPELGRHPVIASISLGATRRFVLRHNDDRTRRHEMDLVHGSLLVMRGPTQASWRHALPKTARPVGPRINLTFRTIHR